MTRLLYTAAVVLLALVIPFWIIALDRWLKPVLKRLGFWLVAVVEYALWAFRLYERFGPR